MAKKEEKKKKEESSKSKEEKDTKKKTTTKKIEEKEDKVEVKPLLQLLDESEAPDYVLMGVLDYANILEQFKEDLIKNTNTIQMTSDEFNKLITNYYNRKI